MLQMGGQPGIGRGTEFRFPGDALTNGTSWKALAIPPQFSFAHILVLGAGGNGGNGAVGANSTAAGGGGGGSGAQSSLWIPTKWLPDTLYISSAGTTGVSSRVCIVPDTTANHTVLIANSGSNGSNAAGATAGGAGAAGTISAITACPLAGRGVVSFLAGQIGIVGGTTVAAAALTLPVTGLIVSGAPGGGGLPAAAAVGTNGGSITVPAGGFFPTPLQGVGGANATTPPGDGAHGINGFNGLEFFYGGSGGGSSHGSATTTGLFGGRGGDGGFGCGGGGGGGALTGSTQGIGGKGGPGLVVVTLF